MIGNIVMRAYYRLEQRRNRISGWSTLTLFMKRSGVAQVYLGSLQRWVIQPSRLWSGLKLSPEQKIRELKSMVEPPQPIAVPRKRVPKRNRSARKQVRRAAQRR